MDERGAISAAGGVAVDEPRAAAIGLSVLANGGTAADAAVALAFSLAVTYPVAAGLGGGGTCLVADRSAGTVENIDFLPRAPQSGGAAAVPGTVRGMAALHRLYGSQPWEDLVVQAEGLARRGTPVSLTLAAALARSASIVRADAVLRAQFADVGGNPLREGQMIRRIEMATVLAQIRVRGAEDFYTGQASLGLLEDFGNGGLTATDLSDYAPAWSDALSVRVGNATVYAAPGPAAGGVIAGQLWAMLAERPGWRDGDPAAAAHWFAEASARAYSDRGNAAANPLSAFRADALMADALADLHVPVVAAVAPAVTLAEPGSTGFVVADRNGLIVGCALTMGRPFGVTRMGRTTGTSLAAAPEPDGMPALLGPVYAEGDGDRAVAVAGAGLAAPAASAAVLLSVLGGSALENALAEARVLHTGAPDAVFLEAAAPEAARAGLASRGHAVESAEALGVVNAVVCAPGVPGGGCQFAADPRSFGFAAAAAPPGR